MKKKPPRFPFCSSPVTHLFLIIEFDRFVSSRGRSLVSYFQCLNSHSRKMILNEYLIKTEEENHFFSSIDKTITIHWRFANNQRIDHHRSSSFQTMTFQMRRLIEDNFSSLFNSINREE